ncbi:hypothetical protein BGX33_004464 [Mortierella sp. NVP41]|nr:hypothetical protein BGX33_004464 [Mortierella sp. NVP41]
MSAMPAIHVPAIHVPTLPTSHMPTMTSLHMPFLSKTSAPVATISVLIQGILDEEEKNYSAVNEPAAPITSRRKVEPISVLPLVAGAASDLIVAKRTTFVIEPPIPRIILKVAAATAPIIELTTARTAVTEPARETLKMIPIALSPVKVEMIPIAQTPVEVKRTI